MFPRHINLTIEHNPHSVYYEELEEYLRNNGFSDEPEFDAVLAAGEVWVVRWYPQTPVGHICLIAASFDKATEMALEYGAADEAAHGR